MGGDEDSVGAAIEAKSEAKSEVVDVRNGGGLGRSGYKLYGRLQTQMIWTQICLSLSLTFGCRLI